MVFINYLIKKQSKNLLQLLIFILVSNFAIGQTTFSLENAIKTAKENNPNLKSEFFNTEIAQSDVVTAKLRPNPKFNNQSLFLLNSNDFYPNTSSGFDRQNRQIWWQVTKVFQLTGQRKNKIELADKNYILSNKNYKKAEHSVLYEVANKWLDVWYNQRQLFLLTEAKKNIDSLVYINQLKSDKQVITKTELYRTQLLSSQYELQIKTFSQQFSNEQKNLSYLLGQKESVKIDTVANFMYLKIPEKFKDIQTHALENRDDVEAVKATLEVSKTNVKLQKALAIPQPELGLIYNPQNAVPYFGIYGTIELPFFDRNQGEIRKSKFLQKQAEQSLESVHQQITVETQTSYDLFMVQQGNIEKYSNILKQSNTILKSVKYAYMRGGTTIVDFLEAQRSWLDVQQQYSDALYQYRKAYIELVFASGFNI